VVKKNCCQTENPTLKAREKEKAEITRKGLRERRPHYCFKRLGSALVVGRGKGGSGGCWDKPQNVVASPS
jgi:hypothetical protein